MAPGVRSFALGPIFPYFSIDGGASNLAFFNNDPSGGDTGDWDNPLIDPASVQDAMGTPGLTTRDISYSVEKVALDVIG